jgi:hypothetical protein
MLIARVVVVVVDLVGNSNRGSVTVDAAAITNLAVSRDHFAAITEVLLAQPLYLYLTTT